MCSKNTFSGSQILATQREGSQEQEEGRRRAPEVKREQKTKRKTSRRGLTRSLIIWRVDGDLKVITVEVGRLVEHRQHILNSVGRKIYLFEATTQQKSNTWCSGGNHHSQETYPAGFPEREDAAPCYSECAAGPATEATLPLLPGRGTAHQTGNHLREQRLYEQNSRGKCTQLCIKYTNYFNNLSIELLLASYNKHSADVHILLLKLSVLLWQNNSYRSACEKADGSGFMLQKLTFNFKTNETDNSNITVKCNFSPWVILPVSVSMDKTKITKFSCKTWWSCHILQFYTWLNVPRKWKINRLQDNYDPTDISLSGWIFIYR